MNQTPPPLPPAKSRTGLYVGIALGVIALLAVAGFGVSKVGAIMGERIAQREATREKMRDFQKESVEMTREAIESEDSVAGSTDRIEKMSQRLGDLADGVSSERDKVVLLAGQATLEKLKPVMAEYQEAYANLLEAGAHGAPGLDSKEALARRRELVKLFGEANEQLTKVFASLPDYLGKQLDEHGVGRIVREREVAGFRQSAHLEIVSEVRKYDRELTGLMQQVLDFYEEKWGAWEVDESGQVLFQEDADVERYNGYIESIQKVAANQAAAQQQLLEAQRRNVK